MKLILIRHVLSTLPRDVYQRRTILAALVESLPQDDVPEIVLETLADLDRHLSLQRELDEFIPSSRGPALTGSARLGDRKQSAARGLTGSSRLGDKMS